MKFKLNENFGRRTLHLFQTAGHNVKTTSNENMQGRADRRLFEVSCTEQRCLVTLDPDFSDVTRIPPEKSGGIAVIRIPRNPTLAMLEQSIRLFLQMLAKMSVEKNLWIVEAARIRVHQSEKD